MNIVKNILFLLKIQIGVRHCSGLYRQKIQTKQLIKEFIPKIDKCFYTIHEIFINNYDMSNDNSKTFSILDINKESDYTF